MDKSTDRPTVRRWLAGPLPKAVESALLQVQKLDDVRYVAVMPDVHLAREVCVGTVLATRRVIYPAAVGGDIGCGIAAVAFDGAADAFGDARGAGRVLDALRTAVPVNRHRRPRELPPALEDASLSDPRLDPIKWRDARVQLGTLGRGNHFLEFQSDEDGRLWLMVHSGSRAIGQAVRDHHVALSEGRVDPSTFPRSSDRRVDRIRSDPSAVDLAEFEPTLPARPDPVGASLGSLRDRGQVTRPRISAAAYLSDVEWARAYAAASRAAMMDAAAAVVAELFGFERLFHSLVACDHNHVRSETHFGETLWVHRKGAASARAGEAGIIPGSMGTSSYLVEGRGHLDALCSSSHGAGRAMSRDEARRRVRAADVARQLRGVWFDARDVSALREEAPSAYKDIGAVMRAQRDLVRITRTFRPVLSYKGV